MVQLTGSLPVTGKQAELRTILLFDLGACICPLTLLPAAQVQCHRFPGRPTSLIVLGRAGPGTGDAGTSRHAAATARGGRLVWKRSSKELEMPRACRNVLLTIFTAQTIKKWNNGLRYVPVNLMGRLNVKRFLGAVGDGRVHPDCSLLGWNDLKPRKNPEV